MNAEIIADLQKALKILEPLANRPMNDRVYFEVISGKIHIQRAIKWLQAIKPETNANAKP